LRIVNKYVRPAGSERGRDLETNPITNEEWAQINSAIANLRRVYPERADSIFNGADDDGSGTESLLEIAEALARGSVRPKRSILFVWHTAEEFGLWGSKYFTDHPSVPRDSIVAQLNIDMVGHGDSSDVTGQTMAPPGKATGEPLHGGARYLQVIGSRRLSTEFGDLIEQVNRRPQHRFNLDYSLDASGHQQQLYCRSDHWSYAKWGIPVTFFTTGGHADYHQPTDEPQYIRYDHMAAVGSLILDVALATANLDHRVVVNRAKSNTPATASCRQ
jgi:Zn-dependent M28 family amino/carboxypeptidase